MGRMAANKIGLPPRAVSEVSDDLIVRASEQLTDGQFQVWKLANQGMSNSEISDALQISTNSVKTQLSQARRAGFSSSHGRRSTEPVEFERMVDWIKKQDSTGRYLSNREVGEALGKSPNSVKVARSYFNSTQPEGERIHGYGYKYGLPVMGGGGLLGFMHKRD